MMGTKTLVTADELYQMPEDGYRYELVKGELIRMAPTGGEHDCLRSRIDRIIGSHVESNDLGTVFAGDTGVKYEGDPDTVMAADITFVSKGRIPEGVPKGYLTVVPDLVVEIVSPNDKVGDLEVKINVYLEAGVRMVLIVHPETRLIRIHRSVTDIETLTISDTLTGGDVLPGFSCKVSEIFEQA
jgi:Uma2 family endonuclease